MIGKLLSIYCISAVLLSMNGCSDKNVIDKSVTEVQQSKENKDKSSTAVEEKEPVLKESTELQDYFSKKDKLMLVGKINNNLDIHMELQMTNKDYFSDVSDLYYNSSVAMEGDKVVARYEGNYYYNKYGKNIRIEAQAYANGYFNIYEFDDKNNFNGSFGGFIYQGKVLKGMWSNKEGEPKYQFYIVKSEGEIEDLDLTLDTSRIGRYSRIGSTEDNLAVLIINTVSEEKFKFHISGYSKPNIGNVSGVASYTDDSKKTAEFYGKESNLKIAFYFDGNTIKVSGNDVFNNYGGAHVTLDGVFQVEK